MAQLCDEIEVLFQKTYSANRKVGYKYMARTLGKYYAINNPVAFQNKLQVVMLNKSTLYKDQKQILFGDKGTNVMKLDWTLLIRILRLTNDPLLPSFNGLYQIRNSLCHAGLGTFSIEDLDQKFEEQKQLLLKVGATAEEVDYWRTVSPELLKQEPRPIHDLLTSDILVIISEDIGEKWEDLCCGMGIDEIKLNQIKETKNATFQDKMSSGFKYLKDNISWSIIKRQLRKIGKEDIITRVIKESYITTGLKELSDSLYERWKNDFSKTENKDFLSQNQTSSNFIPFEEKYVNLDVNKNATTALYEDDLHFRNKEFIKIEDLLTEKERLVFVRGRRGIGKSFLLRQIALQWSNKKMLSHIKYLYVVRCKDLSSICDISINNLIRNMYPQLLENISDEELIDVAEKTAILIDEFDELTSDDKERLSCLLKNSEGKFNVLFTSRPDSLTSLYLKLKEKAPKLVDVTGFSAENIKLFVDNYYKQDQAKILSFDYLLKQNKELKTLACIPVYLDTLCYLNDQVGKRSFPDTKTEFFLFAILLIIQRNIKSLNNLSLKDMCKQDFVLQTIFSFSKISGNCIENNYGVIPKDVIENDAGHLLVKSEIIKEVLVQSGIVFKDNNGDYEIRPLMFTKVFAGIYLFLLNGSGLKRFLKIEDSSQVWDVLPTVVVLHRMIENRKREYNVIHELAKKLLLFKKELPNVKSNQNQNLSIISILSKVFKSSTDASASPIFQTGMKKVLKKAKDISHCRFAIMQHCSLILEVICAYGETVPSFLLDDIRPISVIITYHSMIKGVCNLFEHIDERKMNSISCLYFEMEDGIVTDDEINMLQHVLARCEIIEIYSKINLEVLIRKVRKLQKLHLFSNSYDSMSLSKVMTFVPHLREFYVDAKYIPTEAVKKLSDAIILEAKKKELKLEKLTIIDASNQQVNGLWNSIACVRKVIIHGMNNNLPNSELNPIIGTESSKCDWLEIQNCDISKGNCGIFQHLLKSLSFLEIVNKKTENSLNHVLLIKKQMEDVRDRKECSLKDLILSHLNETDLGNVLTFAEKLNSLTIYATDISDEWFEELSRMKIKVKLFLDKKTKEQEKHVRKLLSKSSIKPRFVEVSIE